MNVLERTTVERVQNLLETVVPRIGLTKKKLGDGRCLRPFRHCGRAR